MPRIGRVVAVGLPHHITQRGNYQQEIFLSDDDRKQYLAWIKEYSLKYGLNILVYCLMQNHVHFIAIPTKEDSLAKTFNAAHMRYSQYFNNKLNQRGHLWQGRFYSCVLDEPHLILAARYIERNPVRAELVKKPWAWQWSSALAHTTEKAVCLFGLQDFLSVTGISYVRWKEYIDFEEEDGFLQDIRKHTLTGRPLGKALFVEKLEKTLQRNLCALPKGRPMKD
ncbi:MAG: transposase [Candidatus Omnitrophica bacterium]|nr:transposase [Candidatus Omnitrophota bacterium]